jgi:4-amino-4-deoxy-L-arabinose transferase-like glycosyltransferase
VVIIVLIIALLGLSVRTALLFLAGNRQISPLSGVGDQVRYLTLADSVFQGRGLTYYGQPTAIRGPLYPLLLAGSHIVFGSHYFVMMRVFQFLIGIAVAFLCFRLATKLFGIEAGAMSGAIALALPTLMFISSELQTEQFAAFLTILFLFFFLGEIQGRTNRAIGMGISSGLAALIRFNCAILAIVGAVSCLWSRRIKSAVVVFLVSGLVVSPWIVRNLRVFHGKVLFSSVQGMTLLIGVLAPEGRAQNGEDERVRASVGWLHSDIEQNDPHRLLFPSEDQLNKQARVAAISVWRSLPWRSRVNLLARKIVTFWLSTDQLLETGSVKRAQRKLRAAGVIAYWSVLALALLGWVSLLSSSRDLAFAVAFYVVAITAAHLPFPMNTRLRIPFFDPLLAVLAGGGFYLLICKYHRARQSAIPDCANVASQAADSELPRTKRLRVIGASDIDDTH